MINKKNLWFLTLFSLILVLSVYYITMPSELLLNNGYLNESPVSKTEDDNNLQVSIEESEILVALRVEAEEQMLNEMEDLKAILTNVESTVEEKNNAFEQMKALNMSKSEEEKLENIIKDKYKLEAFVKKDGDQIRVIVASDNHDTTLANNIMRTIQENYDSKMYISVKFQK
ncbi:MAG: SpoIIIAH-like family protein [Bacilli bacterium]|nr:SpoIIIAH-like family protein [Bacilli bacterium]MCI9433860.1 SpoIIIAH-like family protein [Bacilli bacterium]